MYKKIDLLETYVTTGISAVFYHCIIIAARSGTQCASTWYFWKLPPEDISVLTRAIVWLFYCLHQVFVWGLIYRAQLMKTFNQEKGQKKYK